MQERFYVGIDWGNDRHALCVTDSFGEILKERFVPNDENALRILAEIVGGCAAADVFVGIEDSRLALVEALVARGYAVFSINPKQLDRFRERATASGAKDDRRDARSAAWALRTDAHAFRRVNPVTAGHHRLRVALRGLEITDDEFRRAANQLRAMILVPMPVLLELCRGADEPWFWDVVIAVMKSDELLTDDEVAAILKKRRIRKLKVSDVQRVLQRPHLYTSPGLRQATLWSIEMLVKHLLSLAERQTVFEREIEEALTEFPKPEGAQWSDAELIRSVPGFGPKSTASILVEASDAISSRDHARIRALAGVAPVSRGTGKKQQERKWAVSMRRACSARLRETMHHVAHTARQSDPRCKAVFVRAREQGKTHAHALRNVADRLLSYTMGVLRSGLPYRGDFGTSPPPPPSPSTSPSEA